MSNSEYHRQMAKGKWELNKQRTSANCSTDLAFIPDNEFVELLWENGQIVMQGQNSKPKKNPISTMLPSNLISNGEDAVLPIPTKGGKFGTLESVAQGFSSGTSATVGLVQDDDMVPWLNYSFDYSLEKEYCPEFLTEMSGMNKNSMSAQTSCVVSDKTATLSNYVMPPVQNCANLEQENSYKETLLDSDLNAAVGGPSRVGNDELIQSPQFRVSTQEARFKPIDLCTDGSFRAPPQHSTPMPTSAITAHPTKTINSSAKALEPVHGGSMMNFCHFSRPALSKSNLQSVGTATGIPITDSFGKNNRLIAADNMTVESSVVDSNSLKQIDSGLKRMNGCSKMLSFQYQESELLSRKDMNLGDKTALHVLPSTDTKDVGCQEDLGVRNGTSDRKFSHSPSFAASTAVVGRSNSGKAVEPVVASSSVCSGSSAGRTVDDARKVSKRNSTEIEESGYGSEDVEEESVGLRKPSTSKNTSAKRSRAAEVHNLSERRRRDRINEKMKALQELIPNCNKADKASMLDEAIDYLKTLQLQVQIMSMGSGMCLPPMMLPAGMRHMHAPHLAHFSPVGLGMGMGYGMGMVDMGCSSACLMIPMPTMHGPQIPCVPRPGGPVALSSIPGSGVPVFGVPGHGLPVTMPPSQFTPFPGFPAKPVSVPETSGATTMMPASESVHPSTSKTPPDGVNIAPENCSNSQGIQNSQGTKGSPPQFHAAPITRETGHSKVSAVHNTAQTDALTTSTEGID